MVLVALRVNHLISNVVTLIKSNISEAVEINVWLEIKV